MSIGVGYSKEDRMLLEYQDGTVDDGSVVVTR